MKHRYSRLKLIAIFAAFAIPFGIASYLADNIDKYDIDKSNRGNLLIPPIEISELKINTYKSVDTNTNIFTNHWTLLFWNTDYCDLHCEANLFKMRQARLMLGREASRVTMAYLSDSDGDITDKFKQLIINYPNLIVAHPSKEYKELSDLPTGKIYIVDPLGNIMMTYPKDVYTRDILKDIKWLTKVSKIG